MTADEFRALALSLPEAVEDSHMGHPDFRVRGKIFATLRPEDDWGMVKLTPDLQAVFVRTEATVFRPVNGTWGNSRLHLGRPRSGDRAVRPAGSDRSLAEHSPERLARQMDGE